MSGTESKYSSIAALLEAIDTESNTFHTTTEEYREILKGSVTLVFGQKVSGLAQAIGYDRSTVEKFLAGDSSTLSIDPVNINRNLQKIKREIP